MASNILAEKAREQNIQILQFQNQKLSEQLANLKQQLTSLEGSVSKHEEEKKQYVDTLLCVNRIWGQLNADVRSFSARCTGQPVEDKLEPAEDQQTDSWEDFDPYLRRLLNEEAASQKQIKRNVQDYQQDLSEVEKALHARAAASMQALADLLDVIQQRSQAAQAEAALLCQASSDEALRTLNKQLQDEVGSLQQQMDAAQALQRSTHLLLKQCQDKAFEAAENLKSIKNELADREYELSAAQRKLQRLKQQQPAVQQQAGATGLPTLATQPSATAPEAAAAAAAAAAPGTSSAAAGSQGVDDNGSAAVIDDLRAQAEQLQELLDQRTAEREAEAEAHIRTQRDLANMKDRVGDEPWVMQSELYRLVQRQLSETAAQLDARCKALAALQDDNDKLRRQFETKQTKEEVEKALRSKVGFLQAQVDELQQKQVELLAQKQQLQVSHQQEMARYGHMKTTAELQAMVAALQKEVDTHAGHARKAAEASAAADAARHEAASAKAALSANEQLVSALKARLSAKASELSGLSGRKEELKEQLNDLHAFVEVLTTFTNDTRELVEVRRSEAALRGQVKDLNNRLKSDVLHKQLATASATEASLRQELEVATASAAELKGQVRALQEQVAGLQTEVGKKQAESEAFAQEINEAYNAFEEQRQQNATLLTQLTERDAALAAAQAEKLAVEHTVQQLTDKLHAVQTEVATVKHDLEQLSNLKKATDVDFTRVSADLAQAREQIVAQVATLDQLRLDAKAREDEKAALEVLLEKERSAAAVRKRSAEEDAAALAEERTKRQKLEDSNKILSAKVDRMVKNANTSEAVQELEDEINALRRLLKCNVCHTRQKDVIITKCWHMFCKPCINKNLEARHRKCPGCGHPFGAADVKQFFFT